MWAIPTENDCNMNIPLTNCVTFLEAKAGAREEVYTKRGRSIGSCMVISMSFILA